MKKKNLKTGKRATELKRGKPVRVQRVVSRTEAEREHKCPSCSRGKHKHGRDGKCWRFDNRNMTYCHCSWRPSHSANGVKDIDFANLTIRVHSGKGDKDRLTLLPVALVPALQRQIAWRTALHEIDLAEGAGLVELPGRLSIKYKNANREIGWQFLFPSTIRRGQYRWYSVPEAFQKAMRKAVKAAGILKPITPHTLRHAFTTHALQDGNDIATIQDLLGHASLETTMIYAHGDAARGRSPLDRATSSSCLAQTAGRRTYLLQPSRLLSAVTTTTQT